MKQLKVFLTILLITNVGNAICNPEQNAMIEVGDQDGIVFTRLNGVYIILDCSNGGSCVPYAKGTEDQLCQIENTNSFFAAMLGAIPNMLLTQNGFGLLVAAARELKDKSCPATWLAKAFVERRDFYPFAKQYRAAAEALRPGGALAINVRNIARSTFKTYRGMSDLRFALNNLKGSFRMHMDLSNQPAYYHIRDGQVFADAKTYPYLCELYQ